MPPIGTRKSYIYRGDPPDYDFDKTKFTTDAQWRELDLSLIVPKGAAAVHFMIRAWINATGQYLVFRKKGTLYAPSYSYFYILVANVWDASDKILTIGSDRKLEYYGTSGTWGDIYFGVKGWFL